MTVAEQWVRLNAQVVENGHVELPTVPRLRACIVTCPDPRVDPAYVFGLQPGDVAVVRAAAGRVSPIVLQQLVFLQASAPAGGAADSFELVLMQHTDCGITRLDTPETRDGLAAFLGCSTDELDSKHVHHPYAAVSVDIDALAANPLLPTTLAVTGVVYDVHTGRIDVVERRASLRER